MPMFAVRYLNRIGYKFSMENREVIDGVNVIYIKGVKNRNTKLNPSEMENLEYQMKHYIKIRLIRTIGRYILWEQEIEGKLM